MLGGRRRRAPHEPQEKKSGAGTVWTTVGSGAPLGPPGPNTATQVATAKSTSPEKTRSLRKASGTRAPHPGGSARDIPAGTFPVARRVRVPATR